MPAETHQLGHVVDPRSVLDLLLALLGDPPVSARRSTLASFGVDDEALSALWDAVCEEFAERTLAPELEPGLLDVSMTPADAARVMAKLLATSCRHDD